MRKILNLFLIVFILSGVYYLKTTSEKFEIETLPNSEDRTIASSEENKPKKATKRVNPKKVKEKIIIKTNEDPKLKKLKSITGCQETSKLCPFSDDDPRSFEIEKGLAIAKKLKSIHEERSKHSSETLVNLALDYLQYENDFVKVEALNILKDLPPNLDNVGHLLKALSESHSADFYKQALLELAKYANSDSSNLITNKLVALLKSGPLHCADTIAKNIYPFLSPDTLSAYKKTLTEIPNYSLRHDLLKQKIKQYKKARY